MKEPVLTYMLNDINIIRSSFEISEQFPPDDPIREDLRSTIMDARDNLMQLLLGSAMFRFEDFAWDKERFKSFALQVVGEGYPRQRLDDWLRSDLFSKTAAEEGARKASLGASDPSMYYCEFNEPVDSFQAMQPSELYTKFLRDLIQSAANQDNFASKYAFDRNVYQKFAALMYGIYAGGAGHDAGGGGEPQGAPVPRQPIPPQMAASASKAIPGLRDTLIDDESPPVAGASKE